MSLENFDTIDRRIMRALQSEGRITNAELAERIHLSPSPCLRRVKQLEETGVITGYGARLDRNRLGWAIMGFVSANLERRHPNDPEDFMEGVRQHPRVISCFALAGAIDFMMQVVATDLDDYFQLCVSLSNLPGVKDLQSAIVVNETKPIVGLPVTDVR